MCIYMNFKYLFIYGEIIVYVRKDEDFKNNREETTHDEGSIRICAKQDPRLYMLIFVHAFWMYERLDKSDNANL